MSIRFEKFKDRCERLFNDDGDGDEIEETIFDATILKAINWLLLNAIPVLIIALVIELTVMFTKPLALTDWLRDALSIGGATVIFISSKTLCRRMA